MAGNANNNGLRDVIVIIAVLGVFAVTFFVLREPSVVPTPPNQAGHTGDHQTTGGMDQLANLPTDYNGLVGIGNHNMDQGNYSIAAECYRRALEIDGSDDNVRTDFGACLHAMGLEEQALAEFEAVAARNPDHSIVRFNIGIVYNGMNQPDSAKVYFEKYLAMDPNGKAAGQAKSILETLNSSKP